jgi:uncharacterized membrane protein
MNKGKKKPGAGWIILGILSGYYTLANLDGVQRVYSFLFRRGPQAVMEYLEHFPYLIPYLILPVLTVVILVIGFIKRVSIPRDSKEELHTHDRIDRISYNVNETEAEHYRKQLDGFLKAGIIEKEEYRILINRYGKK